MTSNHQDQERGMALGASEGTNPADTLILDFWSPELWEDKFLLFDATCFQVLHYSNFWETRTTSRSLVFIIFPAWG